MSLQKKCDEIEKQINEIKGPNKNILPISDGIINVEKYLKAKFKILWILKESNDVENGEGGDWSLPEKINEKSWAEQSILKNRLEERNHKYDPDIFPKIGQVIL